jgi:hypothetical protein
MIRGLAIVCCEAHAVAEETLLLARFNSLVPQLVAVSLIS